MLGGLHSQCPCVNTSHRRWRLWGRSRWACISLHCTPFTRNREKVSSQTQTWEPNTYHKSQKSSQTLISASRAAAPTRPLLKLPFVTSVLLGSFAAVCARPLDNRESPGQEQSPEAQGTFPGFLASPAWELRQDRAGGPAREGLRAPSSPTARVLARLGSPPAWPLSGPSLASCVPQGKALTLGALYLCTSVACL